MAQAGAGPDRGIKGTVEWQVARLHGPSSPCAPTFQAPNPRGPSRSPLGWGSLKEPGTQQPQERPGQNPRLGTCTEQRKLLRVPWALSIGPAVWARVDATWRGAAARDAWGRGASGHGRLTHLELQLYSHIWDTQSVPSD